LRIVKPLTLVLVALVIASLVEPAIHVEAQEFPLKVTSSIVTFGGELGFLLNRTLLDHAHPAKTSPILYFWLSTNSLSHINGSELLIATLNVGAAPLVYGTLLVPSTVLAWVRAPTTTVYLKVSASRDVGASAVVSDRPFTLVLDLALTDPTLTVVDALTGAPQSRFAYYSFFNISNNIGFNVNLTPLLNLRVRSSELDRVRVYNVTLTYRDQLLYSGLDIDTMAVYTNFMRGVIGNGSTRLASMRGLIGDFPLLYPELSEVIAGVTVAYQPFNVTLTAYTKIEVRGGLKVDRGVVRGVLPRDAWRAPIASILQPEWLQLYPSVNYSFEHPRPIICTTKFHLDARNFKPGVYSTAFFFRAEAAAGPYVLMPNTRTITLVVDSSGRGSASATLPDNPYGGRFTMVTVSLRGLEGPWALTRPGVRVYPTLSVAGFDNEGAPRVEPRFVPGEYILVHGRGWLDVPFEVMSSTITVDNLAYTLEVVDSRGVDRSGVLAAILRVPPEAMLPHGSTVRFNLSTDPFNSYTITSTARYVEPLVYIQPRPSILRVTPGFVEARISLGADRFPYTAFWEPEQLRRFTVEAIALPPNARVTLYLKPAYLTITGFNETGIGYIRVVAPVPEVPQGVYAVRASWGYYDYVESSPMREHSLRVWATVAVIVPVYGKIVVLPSPYDLTIKGVGFTPGLRAYYDIPRLGLYNVTILGFDGDVARANERGIFIGLIPLSTIARAPGTYIVKVHQRPDNGTVVAELTVTIGAPPPLTVEVRVTPTRYADERIGVWITALYGGIIASPAQVSEAGVKVTLILRWAGGFREAELPVTRVSRDKAIFLAEFTPARLFGPEALGGEVLVVVEVTGRYTPEQQEDRVTTTALISIPPVTLASIVEDVERTPRALAELLEVTRRMAANVDYILALMTEQGALVAGSLEDLRRMLSTLGDNVTVIKLSLGRIEGSLARLSTITLRIEGGVNTTLATISIIRRVLESVENTVISIKGDTIAIRTTDVPGVLRALESLNTSITRFVKLEIEGVKIALGDLRGFVAEGLKTLSDSIAASTLSVVSRVDVVHTSLTRLTDLSTTTRGHMESISREMTTVRGVLESLVAGTRGLEAGVRTVDSKLDDIMSRMANLSEKRDVAAARVAVVEEVRGAQTTLLEELRLARDSITASSRNWALVNIVLTLIALALIAYTVLLVRRPA
jgi:hypothetical protein